MRVFVLNTGRCGSVTLSKALAHCRNYTVGHETRMGAVGPARLDYPEEHVEIDNRLAWFLGGLEQRYGRAPLYVHLKRDPEAVARSFAKRRDRGVMRAFAEGVIFPPAAEDQTLDAARMYVAAVTANIEAFLRDKPHRMTVDLAEHAAWFPVLWTRLGGEGNMNRGLREFDTRHNASR